MNLRQPEDLGWSFLHDGEVTGVTCGITCNFCYCNFTRNVTYFTVVCGRVSRLSAEVCTDVK